MRLKLKPLAEQVIVITGASSGIGLATAKKAAQAGAAVVLVARSETALKLASDEINAQGGRAHYVVADVGNPEDVAKVGRAALARFGGFDTWVNDAGVGVYGDAAEIPIEDHERVFRTNYFGVVNGSIEALKHLRARGGAIINVGSILSDIAAPLMSAYSASKHAVKGFTDSLRIELLREGAPVSVSLIKPSSIATPFPEHARNFMDKPARVPPPVYAPEVVADAILHAAVHPVRQITVGAGGRQMVLTGAAAPRFADRFFGAVIPALSTRKGRKPRTDSLYEPGVDGEVHSAHVGSGRRFSVYTEAQKHRGLVLGVGLLALAAAAAWAGRGRLEKVKPLVRQAVRRTALKAARRHPLKAARLAARHPRQALKLANALR
ncbi:SDR family oxidoreductase [Phenylobacterium sp.]|jgi:short-subunit dehydrogenase|uniref:SDR family oxidoreductase n=1 Tax=Phenylobacterium sp. TaxID=1871053 RepID=UPI002F93D4BE